MTIPMELTLMRCALRPWRVGDEGSLVRHANNRRVYWGRGIATEALRAMTEYAFTTFDLCRLHAGVFEWNPASMRVLEKAGYTFEARHRKNVTKDGETIDRLVYALVRPV